MQVALDDKVDELLFDDSVEDGLNTDFLENRWWRNLYEWVQNIGQSAKPRRELHLKKQKECLKRFYFIHLLELT